MHIGSTISHYKIVAKLGEGGMGVVYKADDTKLNRAVALKFLAEHLLGDNEAKERFLREAQAAAALHHPNICPVYEIDEVDGKTFISMAFLKGETLEERISKGPLPIKDALDIARQVADGLQAAHAEGIVHRDIKPANIIISPEGRPTIMDFGLARLTEASRLTKVDTAMGTVAYMSPEQAQGMDVDSRTDIWALGCVLYEMVSGQRPFQGQYDQALLYEIVHEEVAPLTSIRAGVPMELEFIVSKCLAKDREDRYGFAQETAKDLRTLGEKLKSGRSTFLRTTQMTGAVPMAAMAGATVNPVTALPPGSVIVQQKSQRTLQAVAAVAMLLLAGLAFVHFNQAPPERNVARFSLTPEGVRTAQISPDGKHIIYAVGTPSIAGGLWLRSLDNEAVRELPGTEGARAIFWSPDSAWVGFGVGGQLKRISIDGGTPMVLCDLPPRTANAPLSGTWSPDGERIVFSAGFVLYEVAAQGGEPRVLLDAAGEDHLASVSPIFLPTGAGPPALVYTAATAARDGWLAVLNFETGERHELGPGSRAVYSPSGYLIYEPTNDAAQSLWAWPFSLATLQATGDPSPIGAAGADASVAQDDTLVFTDRAAATALSVLTWRSRTGERLSAVGQPQPRIGQVVLSPDGQRAAVSSVGVGTGSDVWVHDLNRSTATRLTSEDQAEASPVWSPTGREIVYRVTGGSDNRLMRRMADGTGQPTTLVESEQQLHGPDWSPDGRYLAYFKYAENATANQSDILYVQLSEDGVVGEPVAFLSSPANERQPHLSPDGRFLAYASNESGRDEIYIQPFPNGAGKWAVSTNGGVAPIWRPDGKELYYLEGRKLMAVSVSTDSGLTLGQPELLFESARLDQAGAAGRYRSSPHRGSDPSKQAILSLRWPLGWFTAYKSNVGENSCPVGTALSALT